mgnify:CR=1 FL=1
MFIKKVKNRYSFTYIVHNTKVCVAGIQGSHNICISATDIFHSIEQQSLVERNNIYALYLYVGIRHLDSYHCQDFFLVFFIYPLSHDLFLTSSSNSQSAMTPTLVWTAQVRSREVVEEGIFSNPCVSINSLAIHLPTEWVAGFSECKIGWFLGPKTENVLTSIIRPHLIHAFFFHLVLSTFNCLASCSVWNGYSKNWIMEYEHSNG